MYSKQSSAIETVHSIKNVTAVSRWQNHKKHPNLRNRAKPKENIENVTSVSRRQNHKTQPNLRNRAKSKENGNIQNFHYEWGSMNDTLSCEE